MSGKVGRPTKAAIAARERRAQERRRNRLEELVAADDALQEAAEHAAARASQPDAVHAHGLLQKAAKAYVRAEEAFIS